MQTHKNQVRSAVNQVRSSVIEVRSSQYVDQIHLHWGENSVNHARAQKAYALCLKL
jgi:hypothetical protein